MEPNVFSISSTDDNVRQDVFPLGQWTITTRKGIIMQSKCTCEQLNTHGCESSSDKKCDICSYHLSLAHIPTMPDMLFNNNILRLQHYTGFGIEFKALDALKMVEETKDPLRVAVADGWQSARSDFQFAKKIVKPFDWTFTTQYRGTLLSGTRSSKAEQKIALGSLKSTKFREQAVRCNDMNIDKEENPSSNNQSLDFEIAETEERIDVNKLKIREEILFYDDVPLYEDELADHGTAQFSVKVRVMPRSLFILARFYLRVDGVLARINDTRVYHELNKKYLLREYTGREMRLSSLNLPISTLINPNELMNHLPLVSSKYEKLILPDLR